MTGGDVVIFAALVKGCASCASPREVPESIGPRIAEPAPLPHLAPLCPAHTAVRKKCFRGRLAACVLCGGGGARWWWWVGVGGG